MKNNLIPGKMYKVSFCENLIFNHIYSDATITVEQEKLVLYLGHGGTMKIKVYGSHNLYFIADALFFLIGDKTYVENVHHLIPHLVEI